MKVFIQAKPQLRGPNGLRDWYAQLPVARSGEGDADDMLPLGGLLAPDRAGDGLSGTRSARLVWFNKKPFKALLFLLSKKPYLEMPHQTLSAGNGVWLRHLLGGVMVLAGSLGS